MEITLYWGVRNYNDRRPLEDLNNATKTAVFSNINFIANDGLETTLTVNVGDSAGDYTINFPSYLTVNDGTQWFILSCTKTRQGQLTLSLHRNLLGEHWAELQYQPCLFRKASNIDNVSFKHSRYLKTTDLSQVKTAEYPIKDINNGQGWLIGYLNKLTKSVTEDQEITANANMYAYDYLVNDSIENWDYYNKTYVTSRNISVSWHAALHEYNSKPDTNFNVGNRLAQLNVTRGLTTPLVYDCNVNQDSAYIYTANASIYNSWAYRAWLNNQITMTNYIGNGLSEVINNHLRAVTAQVGYIENLNNKIVAVKSSTGTIQRYKVTINNVNYSDNSFTTADANAMYNALHGISYTYENRPFTPFGSLKPSDTTCGQVTFNYVLSTVSLTLITDQEISVTYKQNHVHTNDSLYDVFAIPLGGHFSYIDADGTTKSLDISSDTKGLEFDLLTLISQMYDTFGSGNTKDLIDLQWLPYGPVEDNYTFQNLQGNLAADLPNYAYSLIRKGSNAISLLYWCNTSQYQRQIAFDGTILGVNNDMTNSALRTWNEEHMTRLVSPNYASQFEFSLVKNDGLTGFNVYIAYKPYSPYTRIAPIFSGLYGQNYNDDRGLILSGDFSLDRVEDSWTQYKLQNKNYQLIFDRQIQSMDLQNEFQNRLDNQSLIENILGSITGVVTGAGQGAFTGSLVDNNLRTSTNMRIGAIAGAAATAAAGITDTVFNLSNRKYAKAIRDDNRQASIDQFKYQLGNIKAMPSTLTKIATFNPDYKVYPVLEIYTCTEQEAINFSEAVRWTGYDVNVYAQLNAVDSGYIAATILRFDKLNFNAAEIQDINSELNGGIYLE